MSDRPPSLAERMKEIGWAVFGAGLGIYLGVQLLQSVWVWLMVFGLVVLVGTVLWWRRRF